jgi:hypothetical protein
VKWCVRNKARRQGLALADEALTIRPNDKKLLVLKSELEAISQEAQADVVKKLGKEKAKVLKKVASYYQKLFKIRPAKEVPGRFYEYMVRSIRLMPADKRTWSGYLAAVGSCLASKDTDGAGRLISSAMGVSPPKSMAARFLSILIKAATDKPIRMTASNHPMEYFLSLPKGYRIGMKCRLLVTCEGAGSNFLGNHRGFVNRRGSDPVIVATPCTFSTTNALSAKSYNYPKEIIDRYKSGPRITFDEEGILSLVGDVTEMFKCPEKFFITGFSGGGNPTYVFIFKHPHRLAGAVPCCANFSGLGIDMKAGPPPQGRDVAIRILTGAEDPHRQWTHGKVGSPGIEPQTDRAEKLLKEWGYGSYTRSMLPNVKHSALQGEVLAFVREKTK